MEGQTPHIPVPDKQEAGKDTLTSKEVRDWLRLNQERFTDALKELGAKMDSGFQEIRSSKGWEELFTSKKYIPEFWKAGTDPDKGEFTGAGLCAVASGILEEAIRKKFGDSVEAASVFLCTNEMDLDTDRDIEERSLMPHHAVRFKVKSDQQSFTVDPTYRQFQMRVNPEKMMLIVPTEAEQKIYNYQAWYERMKIKDPENAEKYLPKEYKPGELHEYHLERIRKGEMRGVTEEDYKKLSESFIF